MFDPAKERWELILGDENKRAMSLIVKKDEPEFIVGYVIREHVNKAAQAEDDQRAKLASAAPNLLTELTAAVWYWECNLPKDGLLANLYSGRVPNEVPAA